MVPAPVVPAFVPPEKVGFAPLPPLRAAAPGTVVFFAFAVCGFGPV